MCSILKPKLTFRLNYQAWKKKKEKKNLYYLKVKTLAALGCVLFFVFIFKYKNSGPHP